MPRIVKSGLIQCGLPISEGEGTIQEICQAMLDKHIPFIEEAGKKEFKSFVYKRYSIHHISAQVKIKHGMHQRKLYLGQPLKSCSNMQKSMIWL